MSNVDDLKEKTAALRLILERYAREDRDAEMVLRFMTPLFDNIEGGEVVPPMENEYEWYFFNTESPLVRHIDLVEAASQYGRALELRE